MKKRRLKDAPWYPNAVAFSIGVLVFMVLWRIDDLWAMLMKFIGFFKPVILGCIIAYIVNPLSNWFERGLFKKIKKEKVKWFFSNTFAFILVLALLIFAVATMIPQLVKSVETFADNLDGYMASFGQWIEAWGLSKTSLDLSTLISSSENVIKMVSNYIGENKDSILTASAVAGKNIAAWAIALILSIYLVAEKRNLKEGAKRLLKATFGEESYRKKIAFLHKIDNIFNRYIVFSLIDAIIIGVVNALFMTALGMEYRGLTSFIVGITNLIPTFGPIIGAVIGAFILLMVNPMDALIFLIFTLILQTLDGYVIKPKLFGDTLGVSGLWILVGIIVGSNMFGVVGILLAIPCVAVIDLLYHSYLVPALEKRQGIRKSAEAAGGSGDMEAAAESAPDSVADSTSDRSEDAPKEQ